jgi:hypothetical protein
MSFPYETCELAFDTIRMNRKIRTDGISAHSFTPLHGTPLQTVSEIAGFIDKGEIVRSIIEPTMLRILNGPQNKLKDCNSALSFGLKCQKANGTESKEPRS